MHPWNNWIHCTGSTYATWLRGDPRGWRARRHREHVDGDYRNPPPAGMYDQMFARSKELMKREGMELDWESRVPACRVMVEALRFHHAEVIDVCVGKIHWHALVQFYPMDNANWARIRAENRSRNRDARHLIGIAKKRAARALSEAGLVAEGGVFAKGCGRRLVKNEWHFKHVGLKYIPDHVKQGAAVYSILFGKPSAQ